MTHDEARRGIDDYKWILDLAKEIHKPVHNATDTDYPWWGCSMCEEVYPCPSMRALEKHIDNELL